MSKIFIVISNFGTSQIQFLKEVVAEINSWSFSNDVVIDTTIDLKDLLPHDKFSYKQRIFNPKLKHKLPFQHRYLFAENVNKYDYFLYLENDILIKEQSILSIIEKNNFIDNDEIIGFIRYEIKNSEKYLTDFDFSTPITSYPTWFHNNYIFACLNIQHSGCYFVSQSQLLKAIKSGKYNVKPHVFPYGMMEQAASDIYTQCGFKSKFIFFPFDDLLVHHLPNKYVHLDYPLPRHKVETLNTCLDFIYSKKPNIKINHGPLFIKQFIISLYFNIKNIERLIRRFIRNRNESI